MEDNLVDTPPPSPSPAFFSYRNGHLYCEDVSIADFLSSVSLSKREEKKDVVNINGNLVTLDVPPTPVFLYSLAALKSNVSKYLDAIRKSELKCRLGYAVKANGNHAILTALHTSGVEMLVCVSGNEVLSGIRAGFDPRNIILNGNGKQEWEIKLAIQFGLLLNVDSVFDAKNIANVAKLQPGREVRLLLRIRPSATIHKGDAAIHPYVNTAEASKFGFGKDELDQVLTILEGQETTKVVGIHCHLGSCIYDPDVYHSIGKIMTDMVSELGKRGHTVELLDIGGGIGIDYYKVVPGMEEYGVKPGPTPHQVVPNIVSYMSILAKTLPKNVNIILEPGRSMVADTALVACKVLGRKVAGQKKFVIVDASMSEVIRPCLYDAHHQIVPTKLSKSRKWEECDVVGPICESADFLGHNVPLQEEDKNDSTTAYLAIMDVGAYCFSMSSNYNMRPRPEEIMIDGTTWTTIRERDTFQTVTGRGTN